MSYLFDPFAPARPEAVFEGFAGAVSTDSKCGKWPPKTPFARGDLHPAFKPVYDRLLARLQETGLAQHLVPTIGKRSLDRQCRAICEGGSELSDPSRGAHTAGLAVDFLAKKGDPLFRHQWDVGLDKATHTKVENGGALAIWQAFGNLIKTEFPELTWGGDWKSRYRKKGYSNDEILVGFDPYHVELKGYRKYLPERGYWKCEGGKAVQRSDTTAAAVERALDEEPEKALGLPALLLLGASAIYWLFFRKKGK